MQLDVLTLFPEWFEWFSTQRHVRNAVQEGHEVRTFNPRDYTPLSGGQVDDTPFGGGAGMVLRVDGLTRLHAGQPEDRPRVGARPAHDGDLLAVDDHALAPLQQARAGLRDVEGPVEPVGPAHAAHGQQRPGSLVGGRHVSRRCRRGRGAAP